MSIRIGRKIGKKTFVSLGKSGTYISTWIGGYRLSKFTPTKKSKKTEKTRDDRYDNVDLSDCHLGECMTGGILGVISYFPVVWLFSNYTTGLYSILAGIISVFVVYWLKWIHASYKRWDEESIGDIAIMFFAPFFSFLTIPGLIGWFTMFIIGVIIVL